MTPFNPELDLELDRLLEAPPGKVWRCWTEPALLVQWFTPRPVVTRTAIIEVTPGGRFHTVMVMPDGTEDASEGCILQAIPQRRLIFTDTLEAGYRPARGPHLGFTGIITLNAEGNGTRYHARVLHRDAATCKTHADMGFHDGWGAATTQLDDLATLL
ncbi:SRPBCC family protein [Rhodobacter ferrooxidans]|uniref:Activator of Hsp90 ATPase 1 family protein n=1 Tax=Rhodobacter ferrooxidans TaxID=371731 RepID=C8S2N5_9RHOB|nr:SRPBCC family protein [Rhodobacter sp. SW2]EEW24711.1 Activator of Hsp90 ATPase 1 family protein [Rhodobacter sp. SW2]